MNGRIIAFILAACMIVSSCGISFAAEEKRDFSMETACADCLKALGLFRGVSEGNYALERPATRTEAIVMLIRLLGKENEALNESLSHPFTDVADWADPYIGYAYENGLTDGVSADKFGSGAVSCDMFMTYVLRALGYDDINAHDFEWKNAAEAAYSFGVVKAVPRKEGFLRADIAAVCLEALRARPRGSEKTLADKLIADGVFTGEDYENSGASSEIFLLQELSLINEVRSEEGLSPVAVNETLQRTAQLRAEEITQQFSHERPDGSRCFTACREAGYKYLHIGENIAMGYETAESVMRGWMGSEGHRNNILKPEYCEVGMGITYCDGTAYWCQIFGNPM